MLDERILALKLQKLHKGIIKVIPNEEYSESSETFNDTRENIFTYEQCSEITGHHIKRKEEEQKKMCKKTSLVLACIIVTLNLNARKRKRPQCSPLKKSPQRQLPHSTALIADLTSDGLWAIKQTIY